MADNNLKKASEIILSTEGVTSLAFPGIVPIPKEKGFELEVYVNVCYGKVFPEIAWNIQERIKAFAAEQNIKLSRVNVHIEGVDIKED